MNLTNLLKSEGVEVKVGYSAPVLIRNRNELLHFLAALPMDDAMLSSQSIRVGRYSIPIHSEPHMLLDVSRLRKKLPDHRIASIRQWALFGHSKPNSF
jgi:hypothetical protein